MNSRTKLYFYTFSKGSRVAFASVVNDPFVRIFESDIDPLIHLDIEAVSAMQTTVKCAIVKNDIGAIIQFN